MQFDGDHLDIHKRFMETEAYEGLTENSRICVEDDLLIPVYPGIAMPIGRKLFNVSTNVTQVVFSLQVTRLYGIHSCYLLVLEAREVFS